MQERLDIGKAGTKRCPVCGRRVYDPNHLFCSMKCSDLDKMEGSNKIAREVATLMRQYRTKPWKAYRDGQWVEIPR